MITQDLINFIVSLLQQKKSKDEIVTMLVRNGWQMPDIEQAFNLIYSQSQQAARAQATQGQAVPVQSQAIASNQPQVLFLTPLVLLKNTIIMLKKRFFVYFFIVIISLFPIILLNTMLNLGYFKPIINMFSTFNSWLIYLFVFAVLLFSFLIFLFYTWGSLALVYSMKESLGIISSYKRSWFNVRSLLWIYLLSGFVTLGGLILFIIPGIIFSIWFSLSIFVLIDEDLKGLSALLKSRAYVKHHFLEVLWRLLFIVLGFVLIWAIINLLKDNIIKEIIVWLLYIAIPPVVYIYTYSVYENLRLIKKDLKFVPDKFSKTFFSAEGILGFLLIFVPLVYFLIGYLKTNSIVFLDAIKGIIN